MAGAGAANAKVPGTVHCYNDICHRIRTVVETATRIGVIEPAVASFYDGPESDRFNPSYETSSGTKFDPHAPDNAASPIHPDGTILLLWSPATRGAAVVRVNNAGPYYPGRTLDVSRGVAENLGFFNGGVMHLLTVVVSAPEEHEAHYVRGRVYPRVSGYLGKYDNLALASLDDPIARTALFRGDAPLPSLAFGPAASTVLASAERRKGLLRREDVMDAVPTVEMAVASLLKRPITRTEAVRHNEHDTSIAVAPVEPGVNWSIGAEMAQASPTMEAAPAILPPPAAPKIETSRNGRRDRPDEQASQPPRREVDHVSLRTQRRNDDLPFSTALKVNTFFAQQLDYSF